MVAVVAGNGLGLWNTSANALGGTGALGQGVLQGGGRSYVNAVTGNLVLQGVDERLSGRGADLSLLRTYNSKGTLSSDVDADGWRWDGERSVKFSGTTAQKNVNGTVTRTGGDGHETVYSWSATAQAYVSAEGDGAHDTIKYDSASSQWVWTEGSTRAQDRYADSTSNSMGRLASSNDKSGNRVDYAFDAGGRLGTVTDFSSGQQIKLVYSTTTPVKLQRVETYALQVDASGKVMTPAVLGAAVKQVEYTYDNGRLGAVKTVLNPGQPAAIYFVTTYSYVDTTSVLISSVRQDDGTGTATVASFTYDAQGRVKTVVDINGKQTFTYNTNSTDIASSEAAGGNSQTWTYTYDATTQQLVKVESPAPKAGAARLATQYHYDASGNVDKITDQMGKVITYQYDANGNRTLERDAEGDTIERTFDSVTNQVLSETRYRTANPQKSDTNNTGVASDPVTTHYVYDSAARLRFVVSAEGRVVETRYGADGLAARTLRYTANLYTQGTFGEQDLSSWVSALSDQSKVELTAYAYDLRGNLSQTTAYAKVDGTTGNGVLDAATTVMEYVYDAYGALVQSIAVRGSGRDQRTTLTSYMYDGLGRETSRTTSSGTQTTVYNDKQHSVQVTSAAGLVVVSSYDSVGRLLSMSQGDGSTTRVTQYLYDAQGRLQMTQDALGSRRFNFYDAAGRLLSQVDSTGAVVGYTYNDRGQLLSETHYMNRVSGMTTWVDNAGTPTKVTKATLVVATAAGTGVDLVTDLKDRKVTYEYDDAGRLKSTTDAAGTLTTTSYDGASQVIQTKSADRVTRYFYDKDGRQVGTVDALGYLTETKYDAAGRLVETIRYATRSPGAQSVGAPVWVGTSSFSVTGGKPFSVRLPAYDADGDALAFSLVGSKPSWLTITTDAGGVTLSGTPTTALGTTEVVLRASDSRGKTTEITAKLVVGNAPPTWVDLADLNMPVNKGFNKLLPAAKDEGAASTIKYSASGLPAGMSLTTLVGIPQLTGTPTTPGTYTVTLTAEDAQSTADKPSKVVKSFVITVTNNGPSWASVRNQSIGLGMAFSLVLPAAVDPEGQALTYSVVSRPSWLSFNAATGTLSGTSPNASQALQQVVLQAQDASGEVVQLSFGIVVTGNSAPKWDATIGAVPAKAGVPLDYALPLATDADGEALTYSAISGMPSGLTINPSTGRLQGKTLEVGSFVVKLRATDPNGAMVERDITIAVANSVPVYSGEFVDLIQEQGELVSVPIPSGMFTDLNDALTYTASIKLLGTGAPVSWGTIMSDAKGTRFEGKPPFDTKTVSYIVTITANDGRGATATGSFTVTMKKVSGSLSPQIAGPQSAATAKATTVVAADPLADWRPSDTTGLHSYSYYDGQGRIVGSVDSRGVLNEVVYDDAGNTRSDIHYNTFVTVGASDTLATLKAQAGKGTLVTITGYDALGRVASTQSADSTLTSYQYDQAGRLVYQVSAAGTDTQRSMRTQYNKYGEVTGTLGGEADAKLLTEHATPTQADIAAAIMDRGTRYVYDSLGRRTATLTSKGLDKNGQTLYYYDSEGRLAYSVNAAGEVSQNEYNVFGQVSKLRQYGTRLGATLLGALQGGSKGESDLVTALAAMPTTANQVTSYEYDERGLLKTSKDALGQVTTNTYDAYGRLSTLTRSIDSTSSTTTQYSYDLDGHLLSTSSDVNGLNATIQTMYDAYGRMVQSVDARGRAVVTAYQDSGRTVEVSDALNRKVRTKSDTFGRALNVTDALGQTTVYAYNDVLHTVTMTTPEGVRVVTTNSVNGQTLSVSVGSSSGGGATTTSYSYDKDGQLLTVTDALGHVVSRKAYDVRTGLLSSSTDARGTVTSYAYDAVDRLLTRSVDASGLNLTTTYEFDALGRQIKVTEGRSDSTGNNIARVTSYEYDAINRQTKVIVDPDRAAVGTTPAYTGLKLATTYSYDGLNNVTQVAQGTVALPQQQVVSYEYDALGRRTKEIAAPSSVLGAGAAHTRDLTTEYRYDQNGRVSRKIDANGNNTWYYYDNAGQLVQTVNALGEVSESSYDANGRVVQIRRYATVANGVANFGDVLLERLTPSTSAGDQRSYFIYDADGRQRFTMRSEIGTSWSISESRFDARGNVIETRRYDKFLTEDRVSALDSASSTGITVGEVMDELKGALLGYDDTKAETLTEVQRTRFAYDAANRLRFTVDALGSVSENVYDAAGSVTKSVRYASRPTLSGYDEGSISAAVNGDDVLNQVTRFAYDVAGRLRFTVRQLASDKQKIVENIYDPLGRLVKRIDHSEYSNLSDFSESGIENGIDTNQTEDRTSVYAYDAAGRQVYSANALFNAKANELKYVVTRNAFDDMGHVVKTTTFATPVALNTFDEVSITAALSGKTSVNDRSTSNVYDAAGRPRFTIAADGSFSERVYDAIGQLSEVRYFDKALNPASTWDAASLATARGTRAVGDGATRGEKYAYDAAGRLTKTTDALGYSETNEYNVLGQLKQRTDKNGKVWVYEYDRAGRLYTKTAPATMLQLSTGTAPTSQSLKTRYYYDALGNLTKTLDGVLNTEQRETKYTYDTLGRQVTVTQPGYYDPSTGSVAASSGTGRWQRTQTVVYDALGNAIRTEQKNGPNATDLLYEYHVYDNLGRATHDVDARGYVTSVEYNAFGDQTTVTRYSVKAGAPADEANKVWTRSALEAKLAGDTNARSITTAYDTLGRRTLVTQPKMGIYYQGNATAASVGSSVGTPADTARAATRYEYDAFGDLVHQAVKIDDVGTTDSVNGHWSDTWTYYDVMGRAVRTVDALGYQTTRTYDALGNLTNVREYASTTLSPDGTLPVADAKDRVTTFAYDARNQQTSVQRLGLRYASWNSATKQYDYVVEDSAWATTVLRTTYDGEGHEITHTDALGNVSTNQYNALGQLTKTTATARSVIGSSIDPFLGQASTSPVTNYTYNLFGQVVTEERLAAEGSSTKLTTSNTYDISGNLLSTKDARGNVKNRQVDYAGRVIKETQVVNTTLGSWQTMSHTLERRYAYDELGHLTDTVDVYYLGTQLTQSGSRSVYNAFGEVIEDRRVWGNASTALSSLTNALVATYTYDRSGHVSTKLAADGTTAYFYDLTGQVTRQEQRGDGTKTARVTETVYDALGRATLQRQPSFTATPSDGSSAALVTPLLQMQYDRWGNLLRRTEGSYGLNGSKVSMGEFSTNYTYNADNQLTAEIRTGVQAVKANGTAYNAQLTHEIRYDLLGRQVQTRDVADDTATGANEATLLRTSTQRYNEAGQLTEERDARGYTTQYVYDAFGRRVATRNALGNVFVDSFDNNGNIISHAMLLLSDGETAYTGASGQTPIKRELARFQYDEANRRVGSADVMDAAAQKVLWTYSLLDARSLVSQVRNASGLITSYAYDVLGNRTSQSDLKGNTQTWEYSLATGDYSLGRLTKSTTGASRTTTYEYNNGFGQISRQVDPANPGNPSGINDRTITYYENGLVKQVVDRSNLGQSLSSGGPEYTELTDTTTYGYTVLGQQWRQTYLHTGTKQTGTYDEAGKLISTYTEAVPTVTRETRLTYDKLGRVVKVEAPASQNSGAADLSKLEYAYDELGNRRSLHKVYQVSGQVQNDVTSWFTYDADGHMLIADGQLVNSAIRAGHVGTTITYDELGRRKTSETYLSTPPPWKPSPENDYAITDRLYRQEEYTYNALGQVSMVRQRINRKERTTSKGGSLIDQEGSYQLYTVRSFDVRGNVTSAKQYQTIDALTWDSDTPEKLASTTTSAYLDDGRLDSQNISIDGNPKNNSSIKNTYDPLSGMLSSYTYELGSNDTEGHYKNTYTYTYTTDFGGYREKQINVATTLKDFNPGSTYNTYDARGQLIQQGISDGKTYTLRTFGYDSQGQLQNKIEVRKASGTQVGYGRQDFYYADGASVATLGSGVLAAADFNTNYEPLIGDNPQSYVVCSGDTLASIARNVYGDAQLWYLIADANSISAGPTDALPTAEVGRSYRIPNVVGNVHNNAQTSKPYNASALIGNSTPSPMQPMPQSTCADAQRMLASVMVTAITVIVSRAVGTTLSVLLANPILGHGIGGFAANLAGQAAGDLLGTHDGFSLGEAGQAGLRSAVTEGFKDGIEKLTTSKAMIPGYLVNLPQTAAQASLSFVANSFAGYVAAGATGQHEDFFSTLTSNAITRDIGSSSPIAPLLQQVTDSALNPSSGWAFNAANSDWQHIVSSLGSVAASTVGNYIGSYIGMDEREIYVTDGMTPELAGSSGLQLSTWGHDLQGGIQAARSQLNRDRRAGLARLADAGTYPDSSDANVALSEGSASTSANGESFADAVARAFGVQVGTSQMPDQMEQSNPLTQFMNAWKGYGLQTASFDGADALVLQPAQPNQSFADKQYVPSATSATGKKPSSTDTTVGAIKNNLELLFSVDAEGQTHVNDVFAGTIRQQLISLQDDPQRLEQAAQLMNDDALNAVIASGISTSMRIVSYSSSEITHDTSNAERLLDVIDKIGSLDFRARAFVQGGNILATFSGDVGFPHLAQGTVSADHAEGLGQRLYEMLNKDTYDLISKIYNKDRFSGALSAVLRVPLEKANQGDALSIQSLAQSTVKLQGHFTETGPDEFGRIYRKGVQSLAYFMGAMGAAADSLTSDEEKKLALAASIFTFTTALAAGGAGPYLLGARAIASNTATAGIGFVPGQLVIKYANEYKESIGNTRRLFAKMALPEGLQGDDVNAYLITADQARTRSAQ